MRKICSGTQSSASTRMRNLALSTFSVNSFPRLKYFAIITWLVSLTFGKRNKIKCSHNKLRRQPKARIDRTLLSKHSRLKGLIQGTLVSMPLLNLIKVKKSRKSP